MPRKCRGNQDKKGSGDSKQAAHCCWGFYEGSMNGMFAIEIKVHFSVDSITEFANKSSRLMAEYNRNPISIIMGDLNMTPNQASACPRGRILNLKSVILNSYWIFQKNQIWILKHLSPALFWHGSNLAQLMGLLCMCGEWELYFLHWQWPLSPERLILGVWSSFWFHFTPTRLCLKGSVFSGQS